MDSIDYNLIAAAGGIGKTSHGKKEKAKKNGLQTKTPLKAHTKLKSKAKGIPMEIKIQTIQQKGNKCFMGFCPRCGGSIVKIEEGMHHFPHKGPHSTPDDPKYLWPTHDICQGYYHDHPKEEKELFERIEEHLEKIKSSVKVYWTVPKKGIGTEKEAN
jgi:hypothetical protein